MHQNVESLRYTPMIADEDKNFFLLGVFYSIVHVLLFLFIGYREISM